MDDNNYPEHFTTCCETANVKPTRRQLSKYKRKMGAAYKIVNLGDDKIHVPDEAKWKKQTKEES